MADDRRRIGILGLGSVLMGDDALGPYAVELLSSRWRLPPGVSVLDAGTPGPDLVDHLLDLDAAIVVDTVRGPGGAGSPDPAGTIRLYRRDEVMALPTSPRTSPHDPDLRQALLTADLAGRAPAEVLLVGVVPERVELGTELSRPVRESLPLVESVVVAELRRLGVEPERRRHPPDAATWTCWWEREARETPEPEPVLVGAGEGWSEA
jgi:hydrogenase maturation protease